MNGDGGARFWAHFLGTGIFSESIRNLMKLEEYSNASVGMMEWVIFFGKLQMYIKSTIYYHPRCGKC